MPFKFSFQVSDGHALDILKAITGKVSNLDILPTDNRAVLPIASQPKKASAKRGSSGTGIRNFCHEMDLASGLIFSPQDLANRLPSVGMSKTSSSYVTRNEIAGGRVRSLGGGKYEVL